jgi:phosphomannomutase
MAAIDAASLDAIFKAYDIRGTVPDQLDGPLAERIGAAFARFARADGASRVLVARDMRPSGVELSAAFARGATSQGLDVVDLGLASTDLLFFASGRYDAAGAMLTASHNPAGYNGVKLCLAGARPVGEESGLAAIKADVLADPAPVPGTVPGTVTTAEALGDFVAHVHSFVDVAALAPLRVVADTANGMGGLVAPAIFAGLPFHLEVLFGELDGTFPNHPADPIQPENLRDLQARVLATGADVGLAFDGDADRVFLVDDLGQPVPGSTTTAMVAAAVLEKHPGATILHNLICSKAVPEVVLERGGVPVRTRVGHSFIKAVMAETGAAFGGEHSGHYYFRDNYRADSGIIAALTVLEVLSRAGVPLSELRRPFERYAPSGEINTPVPDPLAVIELVAAAYPDAAQDRLDGLTCDLGDWWFNLRPSNTEPLLRLNLEAATPEACAAHVAEVRALFPAPVPPTPAPPTPAPPTPAPPTPAPPTETRS